MHLVVVHPWLEARGRPFPRSPWSRSRVNLRVLRALTWGSQGQPSALRTPHGRPGVQGIFLTSRGKAPHGWPMVHHSMVPVSQSHGAVAWRFRPPCPSHVLFPFASSRHRPVLCVPWTPYPVGPLCGPSHTPFPAPTPCPFFPCLYPTRSPATLWRWPTGAFSFRGPLRALSTGRSLPGLIPWAVLRPHPIPHPVFIPDRAASNPVARALWILIHPGARFVRLARVAPFPPPSPVPRPRPVACSASWAPWLLFTGVLAPCPVLRVRRPGPPGSCSPLCTPCVWCCVHGFLGLLAPAHRRARSVCGVAGAVSWAAWSLFSGVHARCVLLRARCLGPLGSCSPVCLPRCAASCVRCPGPLGSCSPVCTLCVRCCMCGVLGLLAPVHRCACSLCAQGMLPIPLPHPRLY